MSDPALVDVDAAAFLAHPRRLLVGLTFVAGMLDAVGFEQYGVFTANQAGNLVIGWTLLEDDAAAALLSFASILGCGAGVALVVLLRHRWPGLAGLAGSRCLLLAAAVGMVGASVLGFAFTDGSTPAAAPGLGTADWAYEAVVIVLTAAALSTMATVFVSGRGLRAPVLASTNAYVDAVRYATAAGVDRRRVPSWGTLARRSGIFPVAWTVGAATAVLLPFGGVATTSCAAGVIVALAALARRVKDPADGQRRTV